MIFIPLTVWELFYLKKSRKSDECGKERFDRFRAKHA